MDARTFLSIDRSAALIIGLLVSVLMPGQVFGEGKPAYVSPDRRIVLNELLNVMPQVEATYPVYISKAGHYYLELYLEPRLESEQDQRIPHNESVALSMTVEFVRRGKVFRTEDVEVAIPPGSINQTLLWTRTPWELPQRKEIDVHVTVHAANEEFAAHYQQVRLQLTRKIELGPIFIR